MFQWVRTVNFQNKYGFRGVLSFEIRTMKKSYTTLCLLFSCCIAFSQSVDLDRYNFNASFIELPKMVIDTSYKTYFVEFDASSALMKDIDDLRLEDLVFIDGWRKLSRNGHVKISTRLEDIIIDGVEVKERIEILKDKRGKETGRVSHFYTQLSYTFSAESRVIDYRGNIISTLKLANRNNRQLYNGQEFSSFLEASLHYKYRTADFIREITKRSVQGSLNQLTNVITNNYGYAVRTVSDFLWILDSKKHPEYEAHKRAWLSFKQAMFHMNAEEPLDNVRESLAPVIKYYESIARKYSSRSKSDRKLRYASYYNLAKIHYYLDDPDASMRQAGELSMNDYDEKDGKRLELIAFQLKTILRLNKFTGRHFPLQIETFTPPGIVRSAE